jgi:carboxyl-terminal processing protease
MVQPRPETFEGPVAVLVDGMSGSASEFFAGGLQDFKRARIIGERTMGQALPGQLRRLPNGDMLMYAAANFVFTSGRILEGVGVVPDEEVQPNREALLRGEDLVLKAAVKWIQDQGSKPISQHF